jgi:antitoxin component of RelBE/YafQ-DinJ toxin-antitoxin module
MTYLEQFARNHRKKEKTEVLTARLPESLYSEFKEYCNELGLSISEAVCLLVEREMLGNDSVSKELAITDEYKMNQNQNHDVVDMNTKVVKNNSRRSNSNSNRFTTIQWQVEGQLPCPYCKQWLKASNFSRHAKQHATTTEDLFKNEKYSEKIDAMIQARKEELKTH